jgi:hypothetical protein
MSTYATCKACGRTMAPGVPCDPFPWRVSDAWDQLTKCGTTVPRQPYVPYDSDSLAPCHDCHAPVGGYHHPGCDMDYCPHGQAIVCAWDCEPDLAAPVAVKDA